jgi:phosphoglycerate-specific signal transduction histidine kinase
MDLQNLFYVVATIFMVTILGLIIAIGVVAYYIRKKIMAISLLAKRPANTAAEIGAGLAEGVAAKIKDLITPKKASYH